MTNQRATEGTRDTAATGATGATGAIEATEDIEDIEGTSGTTANVLTTMSRRVLGVILGIYLVLLAIALLAPTNTDQSSMLVWLIRQLLHTGASGHVITFSRMEFVMNVAIIAPATFLGALLLRRWNWRDWTAVGFVGSGCVELIQAVLLPHRDGSFSDVVANTLGAAVGALLAQGSRWIMERRRAQVV